MYSKDRYYGQTTTSINQYRSGSQALDLKCPDCTFIAWDNDQLQTHVREHRNPSQQQYQTSSQYPTEGTNYAKYDYSANDYNSTNRQYRSTQMTTSTSSYNSRSSVESTNRNYQDQYESRNMNNQPSSYSGNSYGASASYKSPQSYDQYERKPNIEQSGYNSRDRDYYSERTDTRTNYSRPSTWEYEKNKSYGYTDPPSAKRMKPNSREYDSPSHYGPPHSDSYPRRNEPDVWCKPDPKVWQAPYMLMGASTPQQNLSKQDLYLTKLEGFYCKLCKTISYYNRHYTQEMNILHHCKGFTHQRLYKELLAEKKKKTTGEKKDEGNELVDENKNAEEEENKESFEQEENGDKSIETPEKDGDVSKKELGDASKEGEIKKEEIQKA